MTSIDPFAAATACDVLTESAPAEPTPAEVATLRQAVRLARAAGAVLPSCFPVRWREGRAAFCARGATSAQWDDLGILVSITVYLRTSNPDLLYTACHELWHVHCAATGRSRWLSLAAEEEEAHEFGQRLAKR